MSAAELHTQREHQMHEHPMVPGAGDNLIAGEEANPEKHWALQPEYWQDKIHRVMAGEDTRDAIAFVIIALGFLCILCGCCKWCCCKANSDYQKVSTQDDIDYGGILGTTDGDAMNFDGPIPDDIELGTMAGRAEQMSNQNFGIQRTSEPALDEFGMEKMSSFDKPRTLDAAAAGWTNKKSPDAAAVNKQSHGVVASDKKSPGDAAWDDWSNDAAWEDDFGDSGFETVSGSAKGSPKVADLPKDTSFDDFGGELLFCDACGKQVIEAGTAFCPECGEEQFQ